MVHYNFKNNNMKKFIILIGLILSTVVIYSQGKFIIGSPAVPRGSVFYGTMLVDSTLTIGQWGYTGEHIVMPQASSNTNAGIGGYFMVDYSATAGKVFAGTYSRMLAMTTSQTNQSTMVGTESQFRLRGVNIGEGVHAGLWAYAEQSGTSIISGGGTFDAISATVESEAGLRVGATEHVTGITIDASINAGATIDAAANYSAVYIKSNGKDWFDGIKITGVVNDMELHNGALFNNVTADSVTLRETNFGIYSKLTILDTTKQTNALLFMNGANFAGFKFGGATKNLYVLPTDDGTAGQFLTTNASAVLSWTSELDPIYAADSANIIWFRDSTGIFITPYDTVLMHNYNESTFIGFADSTGYFTTPYDTVLMHNYNETTFMGFADSTGYFITPYDTTLSHTWVTTNFIEFSDSAGNYITPYDTTLSHTWVTTNFIEFSDSAGNYITPYDTTLSHTWAETTFIDFGDSTGYFITPYDTTLSHTWVETNFIEFGDSTGYFITPYDTTLTHTWVATNFIEFSDSAGNYITPYDTTLTHTWVDDNFVGLAADNTISGDNSITGINEFSDTIKVSAAGINNTNTYYAAFYPNANQEDVAAGGGAASIVKYFTTVNSGGTNDTVTVASGTIVGQMKKFLFVADGGGNLVLDIDVEGGSWMTFTDAGEYAILMWNGTKWRAIELASQLSVTEKPVIS
ncbi:MAG: hypothetical protein KKD77_23635 [Gammaproteobacteria bacterium]|nr:hypothetical protein [Gammaproteobacteria bacterium]